MVQQTDYEQFRTITKSKLQVILHRRFMYRSSLCRMLEIVIFKCDKEYRVQGFLSWVNQEGNLMN
jgi:hypothetical protein